MVRGSRGRHNYIDGQLQKRSRYYIFRDWANTPDAVLAEAGPRRKVVATAPGQCLDAWQWRQPRESRTVFKKHADHVFGGHTWLDVLSQMGGCPCEFMARRARARATREGARRAGQEGQGQVVRRPCTCWCLDAQLTRGTLALDSLEWSSPYTGVGSASKTYINIHHHHRHATTMTVMLVPRRPASEIDIKHT